MSQLTDIVLTFKAKDQVTGTTQKIGSSIGGLRSRVGGLGTALGSAFITASGQMANFAKDCVNSAMTVETEWNRFGAAVSRGGVDWNQQSTSIKAWARDYSDSMGRSVADTRSAMTTLLNYGLSLNDAQTQMKAVSGLAATMGTSQEQAARTLVRAYGGHGRALKLLGLNINDFKDSTTGAIDKQKLLAAVLEKTSGSAEAYANSTQGRVQKFNNAVASIKTDFGKFLIDAITPLLPVVQNLLKLFNDMPGPLKTATFGVMGLVSAFGLLAGPIKSVLELTMMMDVTGAMGGGKGGLLNKVISKLGIGKGTGAAAAKAAVEAEVASVSLSTLGSSIVTMVVPLLEISAVVAIMLPVLAGLAAEAALLAKGLQLVIKGLSFDKVDLKPSVDAIKDIGDALLQLTRAVGGMGLLSVTSMLAVVLEDFGVGLLAIGSQVAVIKKAIPMLNEFKNTGSIDPEAVNNLKSVAEGLGGLQKATQALGDLSFSEAIHKITSVFTGDDTSNLTGAKDRIVKAANTLNQFKGIPKVDSGIGENIKSISDALKSLSDGTKSLGNVQWQNITNFVIGANANSVKGAIDTLRQCATHLTTIRSYTGVSGVDGVLSVINRALGSLGVTVKTLNTVPVVNPGQSQIVHGDVTAVATAIQDLSKLRSYTGAAGVQNILIVANRALGSLSVTARTLSKVPTVGATASSKVHNAVTAVATAIQDLSKLRGYTGANNVGAILNTVNNTLNQLKKVLNTMSGSFRTSGVSMGQGLVTGLRTGLAPAPSVLRTTLSTSISSNLGLSQDGGTQLGNALKTGFTTGIKGLSESLHTEISSMLSYLTSQESVFRSKGEALGNALKSGYESVHIDTSGPAGGGDDSYSFGKQITSHNTNTSRVIHVHKGAIQVDARNKTTAEAQKLLTLALEGLHNPKPI